MSKKNDLLCQALGYQFSNIKLLERALTHRSCVSRSSNERLEFLGDSILNFIIGNSLYQQLQHAQEGDLSRLRASLVRGETLAEIANELNLGQHIKLGVGERKSGGSERTSILADTLEALIAAIYLDADMNTTENCVLTWYGTRLASSKISPNNKDPKTALQEYLQANKFNLPQYQILKTEGSAHQQLFHVMCMVDGVKYQTEGAGSSKRRAEQKAAQLFYEYLKNEYKSS